MGCACSKQIAGVDSPRAKVSSVSQSKLPNGLTTIDTTEIIKEILEPKKEQEEKEKQEKEKKEKEKYEEPPGKAKSKEHGTAVDSPKQEQIEKGRRDWLLVQSEPNPRLSNPAKHIQGEQVAAGWPIWLCAVAGEAIKGWILRRADSFEKLAKIGQGTYSNVYKARDLTNGKVVALKKVRFDNLEPESVQFMAREIEILRRLDHPNIIKLEGLVTSRMSCSLYLIFEYMEHDLAGLAACPGIMFTEAQVKCYIQQLLRGLHYCHSHNVLHRDIKGSNLLLDNAGNLKIADFGLATICHVAPKQAMTSRVVTLWYRPPELLLGATEYDAAIDLWSTGCILAELFAGRPIMPGRTEVEQLHKIFKLCGSPSEEYWNRSKLPHATMFKPQQPYKRCLLDSYRNFPASSLALLEILLAIEPAERGTAAEALQSDFFTTKPLACDPATLPRYPPSKELDAKLRAEGARRHRKGPGLEAGRRQGTKDPITKGLAGLDANPELQATFQKQQVQPQLNKSKTGKFYPLKEDTVFELPLEIHRPPTYLPSKSRGKLTGSVKRQPGFPHATSHSGPLAGPGWKKPKDDELRMVPSRSMAHSIEAVATMESNRLRPSGAEESVVAARQRASGVTFRDKGGARPQNSSQATKREPPGVSATRNFQSDSFLKPERGGPQWPEAFPKQDKASKASKVADSRKMELQRNGDMRESRAFPKEANVFQRKAERISHSGPLLCPGIGAAVDVEQLAEEHERKMLRAARRAVKENSGSKSNASLILESI
ncbi:hypothetical protein O6H91_03G128500 [Diphasiastrum complanatum]|uniref:Uncharacterized protein n=3 Tax=Diphasiastrum complanatum TaxID=34168 RepID=A0ACC2EBW9_DIPCM|nr:hypothetical protein O6H91_03G128500 [Diphasiastrum complanatum]KAJ7563857.1 hypothetical protein O6H91_03G128500 [Diphasiastrum complanatum]KAJ7563858.1 hypothetical protein O6H91_03G128500 [Diphasiastrum complanatum]